MKKFTPESNVMVTTKEIAIISHEKAYVKMDAGCVWSYLLEDGVRVGVAYSGPSRFAVDAIAETKMGAMGESVSGALVGVQLFLGTTSLENISKSADISDLQKRDYNTSDAFTKAVESTIDDLMHGKDSKTNFDNKKETWIFFGKDTTEKKILLVLSEKKGLVFIYGKMVHVVGEDNLVSVSKSGVVVSNRDGKQLIVSNDGISGLDSFVDIGPIVTGAVSGAMRGLKGLKGLKSMKHMRQYGGGSPYESVDNFDWDD
ncbi:MAG: hypothetical protein ACXAAO_03525 [Candidatus Thorarchaeota archaeon]|jgi:hypothetical protein